MKNIKAGSASPYEIQRQTYKWVHGGTRGLTARDHLLSQRCVIHVHPRLPVEDIFINASSNKNCTKNRQPPFTYKIPLL